MSSLPRARPPARPRAAAARRPPVGALALILLLVAFPLLALLPNGVAAIRLGGVSLLWWYGGVIAPALGWAAAVWLHPVSEAAGDAVSRGPGSAPASPRG